MSAYATNEKRTTTTVGALAKFGVNVIAGLGSSAHTRVFVDDKKMFNLYEWHISRSHLFCLP